MRTAADTVKEDRGLVGEAIRAITARIRQDELAPGDKLPLAHAVQRMIVLRLRPRSVRP